MTAFLTIASTLVISGLLALLLIALLDKAINSEHTLLMTFSLAALVLLAFAGAALYTIFTRG